MVVLQWIQFSFSGIETQIIETKVTCCHKAVGPGTFWSHMIRDGSYFPVIMDMLHKQRKLFCKKKQENGTDVPKEVEKVMALFSFHDYIYPITSFLLELTWLGFIP